VRISEDDWNDLEDAAKSLGIDRAKAINNLVRWYLRRPGYKQPHRPEPASSRDPDGQDR
jgi:hypothetical protein